MSVFLAAEDDSYVMFYHVTNIVNCDVAMKKHPIKCIAFILILFLFDQEYGKKLSQSFNELVINLKESAVCSIAAIMKLLAKIEPAVFFSDFQSNLMFVFDGVIKDENYPPVMTKYISVLSYLVVYQTESLHQAGQLYCQMNHVSFDEVSRLSFFLSV